MPTSKSFRTLAACSALALGAAAFGQDAIPKAGLELWIRADSVKVQDGKVLQLYDMSGKNNHPMHETLGGMDALSPALVKNANNGQPTLRFSPKFTGFAFTNIANIRTVIAVLSKDSTSCLPTLPDYKTPAKFFLGQSDNTTNFHPEHGCSLYNANLSEVSPSLVNGKTYINGAVIGDGRKTFFPFKLGIVTMVPTANVKASTIARDRNMTDRSWQGDISEILLYNVPLTDAQRQGAENYLMGRYGINGKVGIRESGTRGASASGGASFSYIRPYAAGMEMVFSASGGGNVIIRDLSGRRLRTLAAPAAGAAGTEAAGANEYRIHWDGNEENGMRAAPGAYLAELEARSGSRLTRFFVFR